jgi:tripartite ATP-independent transporter DctM subunit
MIFALFLLCFVILFTLGMPVAFVMMVSALLYFLLAGTDLNFITLEIFASLNSFVLIAIPMFILTAEVMNISSISDRIFKFANSLVGHIPGGIAHVDVVSSVVFAGMSGSAVADAAGVGKVAYYSMVKKGFDGPFSAAVTTSSAVIGPIIPPSIPMVIFAMVAEASIGKLFLGGIIPGLLLAVAMMVYIYFIALKRKYPVEPRQRIALIITYFIQSLLPMLTPVILLLGITLGVVTVTEAAVLAVIYSCLLGMLIYRSLGWSNLVQSLRNTFITFGAIAILFPAAKLFGYVLTKEAVASKLTLLFTGISDNAIVIILMINLLFLLLGCFSDALVNILLFVPMVIPIANAIGMDPVHFGVMIVLNTMIGLLTPPMGSLLFISSSITGVSLEKIIKETWPFVICCIVVLLMVALFPPLTTFIPNLLMG